MTSEAIKMLTPAFCTQLQYLKTVNSAGKITNMYQSGDLNKQYAIMLAINGTAKKFKNEIWPRDHMARQNQ